MTFLLFQAFLLMAASYFLGAFLGCWWRRTFYQNADARPTRSRGAAVVTAGAGVGSHSRDVPLSEAVPVQPRIEYVATPDGISDATRFERALSGVGGALQQPPPVRDSGVAAGPAPGAPPAKPAPPPIEEQRFAVEPRKDVPPPPPPVIEAPPVPPAPEAAKTTDAAVAAAAAAAAAAMTLGGRQLPPVLPQAETTARAVSTKPLPQPQPKPEPQPQPQTPIAAGSGMAGVAADVRTQPHLPPDRQDLKMIRGIDANTERTLNGLGIWRYGDIARWGRDDVEVANHTLEAHNRVARENWIEQATILAAGGVTDFARRRLRGELAQAQPSAVARPGRAPVAPAASTTAAVEPARSRPESTPFSMAMAGAAGVAAAAAAASRGRATSDRRPLQPVLAPRAPVPPAPPPAPRAEVAKPVAAAQTVAKVTEAVAQPVKVPEPQRQPVVAQASPGVKADLLQRIRGIDATTERLLHGAGVTSYRAIAQWKSADVARVDQLLGTPGRVARENWIEQAQILASSGTTHFARRWDSGTVSVAGAAAAAAVAAHHAGPRPARLAEAMREKQESTAERPARSDVSGLRSVRSEALKPASIGGPAGAIDDLKRIRGIGVLIEKKLNSLGIVSYEQVANWTAADIAHVSEILDFRGRIERENWVEQARILSAGGQTEFSRRVDRGEIT